MLTAGTNLQWVATAAAAGPSSLVVWVIGGLAMFLPLSVCVVYLASRHPDQGGLYVWSKLAFGPFTGFMTGWTYWTSNLPYFAGLLYFAAGNMLFWSGRDAATASAPPAYFIGFAIAGLVGAIILNVCGLRAAKWLNNLGAIMRWVSVFLVVGLGTAVWWIYGAATPIDAQSMRPHWHLTDIIFWSAIAFAWTGPEAASFMGGEIKDARRTVPRALWIAAPMIALLYLIGTASVLVAVPSNQVSALYGVMEAINGAADRLGFPWLVPIAALCVTITCLSSVSAWLGACARIPFAAGIDNFLPKSFAYLHPRYGSPVTAIVVQGVIAGAIAFLGQAGTSVKGAYDVLVDMMVIAVLIPFLALFGAAIKLSRGTPVPGESRILGGRFTIIFLAIVGIITTLVSIALTLVPAADEVRPTLAALKVAGTATVPLVIGAVVYVAGARRARRAELAEPLLASVQRAD
jgi:glutamate:GABA antiporter